ncbi:gamma-glutamyltranspeptidase / glutathione hydrolase [Fistulifera solaris]|uniref:Gamma-glutamyltranspeptidase / glutathione hydrolase n=1 Tax=Fistulifera solaris TaxID=1519565 RepID=A0A1Z5JSH7_FISSO|nr:gamma-glutamyltranspeptidase / glutathione hydrolase [Fistulifera solaris]|eukprot:GAX16728.1 gamma-glutamyltranspeptidase / glutathione hydrolase [Fistulifera solaris]
MADWYKSSDSSSGPTNDNDLPFHSRRSPVLCQKFCVASSQPLASSIGFQFLHEGANAAEAAIAVAAALAVTEPCSTGLGGDMFCLYYSQNKVTAINGSGCSPVLLTLDRVLNHHSTEETFRDSALSVTVPGAARGWEDLLQRHGSGNYSLAQLLEPAAQLAENGFPVSPITSHHWRSGISQIAKWVPDGEAVPLTVDGVRGPQPGEIIRNLDLARVLRDLGEKGSQNGFYAGETGSAIVDAVNQHGGCFTLEDLADHASLFPDPICAEYRNIRLWQVPPNGQGVAGLIALAGLQHLEQGGHIAPLSNPGSEDWYHALIEMMRLGFADARAHIACPSKCNSFSLLDSERIGNRAQKLFDPSKANIAGLPDTSSCTVSFQVVDAYGDAISFVQSNYMGFGTGIVPKGCGFTLQNRGFGFSLDADHPNVIAPRKRPYHTIIPGILTHADSNELYATLSNMGGYMQPQGHLQLTLNMVAGGLDPQAAIDMPRFCIADGTQYGVVQMETGIDSEVLKKLKAKGHQIKENVVGHDRSVFGRAQIIQKRSGVLWAGSDGRADGCAMGF